MSVSVIIPEIKQERAARVIQHHYREMVQKTYNRPFLFAQFQEKHALNPSKVAKLTVQDLDITKKEDRKRVRNCCREWLKFIVEKADTKLPKQQKEIFHDCITAIEMIDNDLNNTEKHPDLQLTIVVDEKDAIQAISVVEKLDNSSARCITGILSSPINIHNKFDQKPHIEGASAALIAHAAFQSKLDNKKGDSPRVLLSSIKNAVPVYRHLGFEKADVIEFRGALCTHILAGENFRQFLRNYAGRVQ